MTKDWKLVNFCEFDKYATKSYCAIHNVDESLNLGDITKVDEKEIDDFNMMTWGFPCTDISTAGKQKGFVDENGNKTRSGMYYEGIRILREKKPALSIIENVKNLVSKKFKAEFEMVLDDLDKAGYNSYYQVLNAKDYGVPQNRERVFIISIRKDLDNGKFNFPEPFDNGIRLKDILEYEVDEKFYISDDKVKRFITNLNSKNALLYDPIQAKRERKSREYNDFAPTLTARDYKDPRLINDNMVKQIGNIVDTGNFSNPQRGRIYSAEGISPTLNTVGGGGLEPKIVVVGRINSSQDGIVIDQDGIAPTHTAGHGNCPKIVCMADESVIKIPQTTKQGYVECKVGGVADLSYPNSKTRRGRVQDCGEICPTITATQTGVCRIEPAEQVDGKLYNYLKVIITCLDFMNELDIRGGYEEKYKELRKILQVLWEEIRKEKIQWQARGLWCVCSSEILQSRLFECVLVDLTDHDYTIICNRVYEEIEAEDFDNEEVPIGFVHSVVEHTLLNMYPEVGKSYQEYRNYKLDFVKMMDEVYEKSQSIMYIGDKDNANTDSALVATKRSLVFNVLNKALYQKFFMTTEERQACNDGYIYVHDMSARRDTFNCCLFRVGEVMKGGFEMGNLWYNEPNSLDTAFDVMGDIILSTAAQQYGGFTVPRVDSILAPYAEKSYRRYYDEYMEIAIGNECTDFITQEADEYALKKVKREFEQGWQGIEMKLNSVGSSRGDYPFVTMTFGLDTSKFGKMASITFLNTHKEGQGKKGFKRPVLFPKLVFLYDEKLHGEGCINEDVFNAGIECSMKTMYPDWLSLTGDGYVPGMYKEYGEVVSPMGCVDGKEIVTYQFGNKLYVESFERMWNRLTDHFEVKQQIVGQPHLYMELKGVLVYDTKKGFVNTKKIIRNVSNEWVDIQLSNGRRLLCTSDHKITTCYGTTKEARELNCNDNLYINSTQYNKESIAFNIDKAWLLGVMLCDGCYQNNHVFISIAENGEDEIAEKYISTMKKYFSLNSKVVNQNRGNKGNYKDICTIADDKSNLQYAINYFTSMFGGINKKNRHIPNEVFSWNNESKYAFLAGMIDADGYINPTSHGGSVVQIGSTNKELALQQMALAQSLGMPAKVYHNHYSSRNPNLIRYRVEFYPNKNLIKHISCDKKRNNYVESFSDKNHKISTVVSVNKVQKSDYSYDVDTDSSHFEVSGIYSHNCRAFLSPWYERGGMYPVDEHDKAVFEGRFNLGVVSLHLPMILAKAKNESKDFYEVLDYYLEMIRNLHKRTYDYIGEMKASVNPVAFCEGGLYGGHLQPTDKIKSILKPMTLSFGITALNELQEMYNGKSLVEDGQFAIETMKYINEKINKFKEEDGLLYAIYGTPAESLCGLQVEQFRKKYGIIENVSDRKYVSNSFHCHVSEDITPIEKQNLEGRFWNYFNGGKIQYCRYPINYNKEAVVTLIRRAMKKGYYEGVNLSLSYCEACGYEELEMDVCPKCGSKNITKIDRMNGYLGFTRVHGDTRYNDAKNAEIKDRKSM